MTAAAPTRFALPQDRMPSAWYDDYNHGRLIEG